MDNRLELLIINKLIKVTHTSISGQCQPIYSKYFNKLGT